MPTCDTLRSFCSFCIDTKKGQLEDKLCIASLWKYIQTIAGLIRHRRNKQLDPSTKKNLKAYIYEDCVAEGASKKARPRPVATTPVVLDLVKFLWTRDIGAMHPRMRLQLSCLLLILLFQGIRPGSIVESSAHKGVNEGVFYKDLTVRYIKADDGKPRIVIDVQYRNLKGARGHENRYLTVALLEDRVTRQWCPAAQLLALAILDGALEGVTTAADLKFFEPNDDLPSRKIRICATHREKPVFRACLNGNSVSPSRILTGAALEELCKALGDRAGYEDPFLPYCIRRGHGQMIDGKFGIVFHANANHH
jgi:hypothetical protein